jgi:hypothetical protein
MTATPRTTKLGPDQVQLKAVMRRLASAESSDVHVLSVYVDIRPQAHGERPAARPELTAVRHRLAAIQQTLAPHALLRESLDADVRRIHQYLEDEDLSGADGLALFASDATGLWEEVRAREPFTTQVAAGPTADLFQLARLLDDSESAVVAVVDTNTCRLFVTRRGGLDERPGADEPPDIHERQHSGGWSQARYQRHIDYHDQRFVGEAVAAIERLVADERAIHLVLAGDDRVIPLLDKALPDALRERVEHVAHLQMRAETNEVRAEVMPILAAIEEADATAVADRAVGAWMSGDLGVVGIDATMAALERGQVDELVIDEARAIDEALRAELVRQATLTDAGVEIVHEHDGLAQHEGVAATLRFRI